VVEMQNSAQALGARDLRFLDFVDPWMEIGGEALAIDAQPSVFCAALAERIGALRPDIIVTHGSNGEYGHPQHVYTHRAVLAALGTLAPWRPAELLTWCANAGDADTDRVVNQDDPADIALDISPWFDRKVAAAQAHVSQHAMFLRNNSTTELADALRRHEAFKRWPLDRLPAVSAVVRPDGREVDTWK
jgi:LmbE family N-acetylglucosaminyl deacetylase